MCRKEQVQSACLLCIGLGMILGHCLESWLLCCCGGSGLILLGLLFMKRR